MSDQTKTVNLMKLIVILSFQFLSNSNARHVNDNTFSRFSAQSFPDDLVVAAAEPRPVFAELPESAEELSQTAHVLPLIADDNTFGDSALSEASEKVEKILQRPLAFSYDNKDQSSEASEVSAEQEKTADVVEVDQKPAAIDYYKYLKNVEPVENEEGAGNTEKSEENEKIAANSNEETEDHEQIKKEEVDAVEDSDHADNKSDDADGNQYYYDHADHKSDEESANQDSYDHADFKSAEEGETQESNDHAHHKKAEESGTHHSQEHADHKAAESGGGGGGHGGHHDYKKGGGKEHYSDHKGEKGEKGDKGYKGHHHNEKGEKGHHTKEDHEKEYDEKGGHKKKNHHDDGYTAEHHKGEKGHKGSKFTEKGDHSKGHSTKGEHSIHKKDEYEKRQEFYDESHEEDGVEKDGEYFHESDYKKGGHEKGGFAKGGAEESHHGKKHHYDKGGHFKEGKGHKDSKGHDAHYEHDNKYGEKESNSGGKKWSYGKGNGGGGGGGGHKHGGKYQQADSSNIPVHVVQPTDTHHKDTVVQSTIPKLILEEDVNHFKEPNVLYPPLKSSTPNPNRKYNYVKGQRKFDEYILSKPNRIYKQTKSFIPNERIEDGLVIQRRNDEDDENEGEGKQAYSAFPSAFTDELEKKSKDLNTDSSKVFKNKGYYEKNPIYRYDKKSKDSEEYDELIDDTGKRRDEVGAYSIYRLGDYKLSTVSPIILTVAPLTETEIYEKPRQVAISSDNVDYSSIEEVNAPAESQNEPGQAASPVINRNDITTSKLYRRKIKKKSVTKSDVSLEDGVTIPSASESIDPESLDENDEVSKDVPVSTVILRNSYDSAENLTISTTPDNNEQKNNAENEEVENIKNLRPASSTMQPILVEDIDSEEIES